MRDNTGGQTVLMLCKPTAAAAAQHSPTNLWLAGRSAVTTVFLHCLFVTEGFLRFLLDGRLGSPPAT